MNKILMNLYLLKNETFVSVLTEDINLSLIKKPVILFLHGFMGSVQDWLPIAIQLENKFICLAIDLPYHGNNNQEPVSIHSTSKKILNYLEKNKITNIHLVAYSMGGRIAWDLLINQKKNLFSKAIIESSSLGIEKFKDRYYRRKADKQIAKKIIHSNFKDFLIHWYSQPLFGDVSYHSNYKQLIQLRMKNHPKKMAIVLKKFSQGRQKNLWKKIYKINIPILFLSGDADRKYFLIGKRLAQKNSLIIHKSISAGHNIHFEKPNEFINEIISFFQ